jgi:hypothetical protein
MRYPIITLLLLVSFRSPAQDKDLILNYIKDNIKTYPLSSSYWCFAMMGDEPMREDLGYLFYFTSYENTLPKILIISETNSQDNQTINYIMDVTGIEGITFGSADGYYNRMSIAVKSGYTCKITRVNLSTKIRENVVCVGELNIPIGSDCDMNMLREAVLSLSKIMKN